MGIDLGTLKFNTQIIYTRKFKGPIQPTIMNRILETAFQKEFNSEKKQSKVLPPPKIRLSWNNKQLELNNKSNKYKIFRSLKRSENRRRIFSRMNWKIFYKNSNKIPLQCSHNNNQLQTLFLPFLMSSWHSLQLSIYFNNNNNSNSNSPPLNRSPIIKWQKKLVKYKIMKIFQIIYKDQY